MSGWLTGRRSCWACGRWCCPVLASTAGASAAQLRVGLGLNGRACHASQGWHGAQTGCVGRDSDERGQFSSVYLFLMVLEKGLHRLHFKALGFRRLYAAEYHLAEDLPLAVQELSAMGHCPGTQSYSAGNP